MRGSVWRRPVWYLDPFFVAGSLDDPLDVDAGYVDVLFSEGPNIHHLLHLHRDTVKCLTTIEIKFHTLAELHYQKITGLPTCEM